MDGAHLVDGCFCFVLRPARACGFSGPHVHAVLRYSVLLAYLCELGFREDPVRRVFLMYMQFFGIQSFLHISVNSAFVQIQFVVCSVLLGLQISLNLAFAGAARLREVPVLRVLSPPGPADSVILALLGLQIVLQIPSFVYCVLLDLRLSVILTGLESQLLVKSLFLVYSVLLDLRLSVEPASLKLHVYVGAADLREVTIDEVAVSREDSDLRVPRPPGPVVFPRTWPCWIGMLS